MEHNEIISKIESELGFSPNEITSSENFQRFGKKNKGWLIITSFLHNHRKESHFILNAGDWSTGKRIFISSLDNNLEPISQLLIKKFNDVKKRQNKKIKEEKIKNQKACIKKTKPVFEKSSKSCLSPYMKHKGFNQNYSSRNYQNGTSVIPVYGIEGFRGLQYIWYDKKESKFIKRFSKGIITKEAFTIIEEKTSYDFIFLCEGFSTGATIQKSFPNAKVFISFTAYNLSNICKVIREIHPN